MLECAPPATTTSEPTPFVPLYKMNNVLLNALSAQIREIQLVPSNVISKVHRSYTAAIQSTSVFSSREVRVQQTI